VVKNVLVVEDNKENAELLFEALEAKGYKVRIVRRGDQVENAVKSQRPDLVLMDIHLPGIDGYMATRRLKSDPSTRDIPVIAVTAYTMEWDREKALWAGCNDYISKPVNIQELYTKVKKFIDPP